MLEKGVPVRLMYIQYIPLIIHTARVLQCFIYYLSGLLLLPWGKHAIVQVWTEQPYPGAAVPTTPAPGCHRSSYREKQPVRIWMNQL